MKELQGMDRCRGVRRDEVKGWIRGRWEMQMETLGVLHLVSVFEALRL